MLPGFYQQVQYGCYHAEVCSFEVIRFDETKSKSETQTKHGNYEIPRHNINTQTKTVTKTTKHVFDLKFAGREEYGNFSTLEEGDEKL